MKRSERLSVVEKLIAKQEQQMAQALGIARQQLAGEEKKQAELEEYLVSYQDDLTTKSQQGVSGAQWQNYQFFIEQLESVILQQKRSVYRSQEQVKMVTQKWQQINIKKKSMGGLIDNIRMEELVEQEKKDQKVIDDMVTQMMSQKNRHDSAE